MPIHVVKPPPPGGLQEPADAAVRLGRVMSPAQRQARRVVGAVGRGVAPTGELARRMRFALRPAVSLPRGTVSPLGGGGSAGTLVGALAGRTARPRRWRPAVEAGTHGYPPSLLVARSLPALRSRWMPLHQPDGLCSDTSISALSMQSSRGRRSNRPCMQGHQGLGRQTTIPAPLRAHRHHRPRTQYLRSRCRSHNPSGRSSRHTHQQPTPERKGATDARAGWLRCGQACHRKQHENSAGTWCP